MVSGAYARGWVRFWATVRARASDLLERPAVAGNDYAMTGAGAKTQRLWSTAIQLPSAA
jgi:hypothetical protein